MQISISDGVLALPRGQFLVLRAAAGVTVEVRSGRLWITEDGDRNDYVVESGARHRISARGPVVITAQQPSDLRLEEPPAGPTGRGSASLTGRPWAPARWAGSPAAG